MIKTLGEPHAKANYCSRRAQSLTNPTLESHSYNVGLKSHTLQLDSSIPPRSAAPMLMQAGCVLASLTSLERTLQCPRLQLRDMVKGFNKFYVTCLKPNTTLFFYLRLTDYANINKVAL
ncbi:hypothetical protein CR513_47392, partial [Mucuna pruriens]